MAYSRKLCFSFLSSFFYPLSLCFIYIGRLVSFKCFGIIVQFKRVKHIFVMKRGEGLLVQLGVCVYFGVFKSLLVSLGGIRFVGLVERVQLSFGLLSISRIGGGVIYFFSKILILLNILSDQLNYQTFVYSIGNTFYFHILFNNMGKLFSKCKRKSQKRKALILGLSQSGKTTILYSLKLGQLINSIPTLGFNVQQINHNQFSLVMWDVGGSQKIRQLWKHYYQATDALIFVIDSSDKTTINQSKNQLHKLLNQQELAQIPLLVFANKSDLNESMTVSECLDLLDLNSIKERQWFIQKSCGLNKQGLWQGIEWLMEILKNKKIKKLI